ncbi:uncharacterized protein LOC141696407 [Apium graveolens]|uniref:uncharacterized protein LOC141696407 n=1 Tax=Apium graveolens TaxID=4045 RepID=UPI003D7B912B
MDICMRKRVVQEKREVTPNKVEIFKERIGLERDIFYDEDVNRMWNRLACTIRNVATDMLGVTSRKVQVQKEAWWWDQEVQERVKIKHDHFRELLCRQDDEQVDMRRILYKEARRTAKKTVAEVKSKAYEVMYNHLCTKKGQMPSMSRAEVKGALQKMGRGRSTIEAIHLLRQLMEKYREHSKDLHLVFIDLEKAYDSVPREVIWKSLVAKGVPWIYLRAIQEMYFQVRTCVRTPVGDIYYFAVEIGLHQGSSLSPFLFAVIIDVLTRGIQDNVPWGMLFVDGIVIIKETRVAVNVTLER